MSSRDYIWDLGGTLLDNYEHSTAAFVETLVESDRFVDHHSVYEALKDSTNVAIERFASDIPDFLETYKKKEAKVLVEPSLFVGAKDLLKEIVEKGGRNFLISHRDHQVLEILEKTAIAPYFTEVVTATNGFKRKPDPESILYLKEKYQIESALVIGDRLIDVTAGRRAGFEGYLFRDIPTLRVFIENVEKE